MVAQIDKKIQITSKPENLNIVEKLIENIKEEYKLGEDSYGNILVAVSDAVNNAILHGNKANPEKKVDIGYQCKDNKISFIVTDEGEGFNHYNLPDPTAAENIEKPSGRGVFLMKHLSDHIIFSNNGRTVELYFKIINN